MKTITILTAFLLVLTVPAFAQDHGDHKPGHKHENHDHDKGHDHEMKKTEDSSANEAVAGRTVIITVDGMVCDFCARSLTKVLKKKDAVETVDISLEDKTVTILLAEGGTMSDEEIEEAVKNAGYNLASLERL